MCVCVCDEPVDSEALVHAEPVSWVLLRVSLSMTTDIPGERERWRRWREGERERERERKERVGKGERESIALVTREIPTTVLPTERDFPYVNTSPVKTYIVSKQT